MITVYKQSTGTAEKIPRCEVHEFTYQGSFMGERHITFTLRTPFPVDFDIGDRLEYRGETFVLNYLPAVSKTAATNSHGEAYVYDSVKFNSLADELTRCDFLNCVPGSDEIYLHTQSSFAFYAASVKDLTDRIQANLDRLYTKEPWKISINPELVTEGRYITVNTIKCWEALTLVNKEFGANFTLKNREILVGYFGEDTGKEFTYGKGNGLYDIKRVAQSEQTLITRLRAYGSQKNLPVNYYNSLTNSSGEPLIPELVRISNLMLPEFSRTGQDVWIDSANQPLYGIREATVFFDGSGELPDIFPTLEGMTAEELQKAGIPVNATGRLDEIVSAENPEDDGRIPIEGEIPESFVLVLKDVGFEPQPETIVSMKSGICQGREFEVVECQKSGDNYRLTCMRELDTALQMAYPNRVYALQPGDRFVLTGLDMPDVYVQAAEQRLEEAAREYLALNDQMRFSYQPKIDEIFMARNPEIAAKLREGGLFHFSDRDLGINASILIDTLTIREGGMIPTYEVTLLEDKVPGTLEKIQNSVTSLMTNYTSVTTDQVKSLISSFGGKLFLSRNEEDTAMGRITFRKGLFAQTDQTETSLQLEASNALDELGNVYANYNDRLASYGLAEFESTSGSTGGGTLGSLSNVDAWVDSATNNSLLIRNGSYWVAMPGILESQEEELKKRVERQTMEFYFARTDMEITESSLRERAFLDKLTINNEVFVPVTVMTKGFVILHSDKEGEDISEIHILDEAGNDITGIFTRWDYQRNSTLLEHFLYYNGQAPLGTLNFKLKRYNK